MHEDRLFAVDEAQGRVSRLAQSICDAGGCAHQEVEEVSHGLRYVHCSCGHRGSPGVTWADAYTSQFVHLRSVAALHGVSVAL